MSGSRLRSFYVAKAKDPLGRAVAPPLEVTSISVWSPPTQSTEPPHSMPEDVGRGPFGAEGEEDSLLANTELAAGAISSILQDSDLRKADALPVEDALALSLQGVVSVSPYAFVCPSHHCITLYINFTLVLGRWLPI